MSILARGKKQIRQPAPDSPTPTPAPPLSDEPFYIGGPENEEGADNAADLTAVSPLDEGSDPLDSVLPPHSSPAPTPIPPSPNYPLADSAALLNQLLRTPAVQAAAADILREAGLATGPKYDAQGNSAIVSLDGSSLALYRDAWVGYNQTTQGRKLDFSEYLSMRTRRCAPHVTEKHIFLDADSLARIERIADENFLSGEGVANWVERYRLLHVKAGEEMLTLEPIESKILMRLEARLWDRYGSLQEFLNELLKKAMYEEVGEEYFLR
jgi:hypothetical protein